MALGATALPTAADAETRPSPYEVCGTITEAEAAPSSNMLWTIRQCNSGVDKVVAYHSGNGWTPYILPGTRSTMQLNDLAVVSDTDVWVLDAGRVGPVHWDGNEWTRVTDDVFHPGDRLVRVSQSAANNVWIVGFRFDPDVGDYRFLTWHWDGASWHEVMLPANAGVARDIVALSPTDVWVSSDVQGAPTQAFAWHWDGASWTNYPVGTGSSRVGTNLVASSSSDVWMAVAYGVATELWHWNGQSWNVSSVPDDLPGNMGPRIDTAPNGDLWTIQTVGEFLPQDFLLAHTDGASWDWDGPPQVCNFRKTVLLRDLEVMSNDGVYAVGGCSFRSAYVYTLAFHYDGSSWTRI